MNWLGVIFSTNCHYWSLIMKIISFILLGFLAFNAFAEPEWNLAKDEDGVVVYTRPNSKTQLKSFKASVIINAPYKKVIDSMHRAEEHTKWFYNRELTKVLENKNNQEYIVYSVTSAPWPVSYRDVVISYNFNSNKDDTLTRINVANIDNYLPEKEDLVRIPYLESYWEITKLDKNKTKVIFENSASLGGNIPNWLADSGVVDMPFYSLYNLKAMLEN